LQLRQQIPKQFATRPWAGSCLALFFARDIEPIGGARVMDRTVAATLAALILFGAWSKQGAANVTRIPVYRREPIRHQRRLI
jgi:hypothetical protein